MTIRSFPRGAVLILVIVLTGCSPPAGGVSAAIQKPLVVFLVRHAEKIDSSADPGLSMAGRQRAAILATTLRSANIEYVHSSDFIRTKDTAAPVAAGSGLEVRLYDPRDLPALAGQLRQTGGRHLVVGHSNTTPELVQLLGGDPGSEIDEAAEYDRLYVLTIGRDGMTAGALLRFGEPCTTNDD